MAQQSSRRILAWWYVTIGIGFVLLGIRSAIGGQKLWMIAIRFVIAAGFGFLGASELRASRRSR